MAIFRKFRKKLTLRRRIALLLSFIALCIALIAFFTIRDRYGLSLFNRLFTYDNETSTITFSHSARSEDIFVGLNYKMLVCTDAVLQLYSPTGNSLLREQLGGFTNPAVSSNNKQAVVYDAGGQSLYVIAKDKIAFSQTLSGNQYFFSANINNSGWLAVATKEEGYKGVVTVYNASYSPVFRIRMDSYLVNAMVTPDCKGVYILMPGQSNGIFDSRLLYYSFNETRAEDDVSPTSQISLSDNVVLDMRSTSNRCWVLTESLLYILNSSGELLYQYTFDGYYIKRASLSGNDFVTLLLSQSQSGNSGTLITVDGEGVALGSIPLEEQVLALSSSGRYVAVLTSSALRVYNKDLSEISVSENIQGVKNLLVYADGSISLITDELTRLYIP